MARGGRRDGLRSAPAGRLGLLALLLVAAAGAMPPAAAGQGVFDAPEAQFSFSGVDFPAVVDTFAVVQVTRWPDPALGVHMKYASPIEVQLDLYAYPVRVRDATATMAEYVAEEFRRELATIQEYYAERGGEVEPQRQDTIQVVTPSGRVFPGWLGETVLRRGAEARRSLLYLFEKDGWYLKYRVTHHRGQREVMQPRIQRFLAGSLERVSVP